MKENLKALVVAAGIAQKELIRQLKQRGIYTIVVDKNEKAVAVKSADKFYPVSTLDVEGIKQVAIDEKVDFVITACADQVLLVVAKVSEELGLPCYIDSKTAVLVSDKKYMKQKFIENDVPTAKHVAMKEFDEAKIANLKYPLIVKPVDCYSSRGVKKVTNLSETKAAFANAIVLSRDKTAIVEEFCQGEEVTVDVYVEDGKAHVLCCSISDKIKDKEKFVIYRTKHPAPINKEVENKIADAAQKIADGFNIKNAPMLIQLISDGKDIYVLEFCARTGGAIKYDLIRRASGFDVIRAVIDLTLGLKPHVEKLTKEHKYIVNSFFYCYPGKLGHLENFQEAQELGYIANYHRLAPDDASFTEVSSSGDRVASITVVADDLETLKEKYNKAVKMVKAIDEQTGKDIIRHDLVEELTF